MCRLRCTLQHPVEDVPGGAGREVGHQDADPDAEGAGQGEHRRGQEEGGAAEVGLGEVEAEAEGHERLVPITARKMDSSWAEVSWTPMAIPDKRIIQTGREIDA